LNISDKLDLKAVAPLLCAGITTYSPLRFAGVTKGTKVGVMGLGGLGHMAVKFAVSFGAEVTVLSTSPHKEKDANALGAKFALSTDKEVMKKLNSHFDVIVDAISANHDFSSYLDLLDTNGKLLVVGLPIEQPKVSPFSLITNRRSIIGSCIGGIKETQEMLDYCAQHNIVSDIELINMQEINTAYERMLNKTNPDLREWYLSWAVDFVKVLQNNPKLTWLAWPFVDAWSKEMAYQMGGLKKGNILGKSIMFIGDVCCHIMKPLKHKGEVICQL
jgi:uncharacterized zinc-type alcohol dehydrogenase-like protein